ncbi:hypothetical protein HPB47_020751 [Ixodes persulcatus]|uniref:Uncharacterized protein n=1 Tax=Ixodes persulcatus TaxID=34615 RepID=A0AC60QFE2_IXOPE|nr:hypothetical protein HPB47_020751 [Ixodes persulcatus]
MPQREVARMTGRTRTAVARIFTAFRDDNGRIHDAPHDVRPRSTTDEEDRWIVAAAVDQPFITARDIRGELGLNILLLPYGMTSDRTGTDHLFVSTIGSTCAGDAMTNGNPSALCNFTVDSPAFDCRMPWQRW